MTQADADTAILKDKRILVVEDEAIVAMLLEDMLGDLGCIVVGPANSLQQGEALVANETVDAAILDVNVAGQRVYPLAEALAAKGAKIVFATGYGEGGLEEPWRGHVTVQKPYTEGDIVRALKTVFGG